MQHDEIQRLGQSLRAIDPALLRQGPATTGGRREWYQGGEPYFDVYVDLDDDGRVVWLQLTLRGHSVTLDGKTGAVQTGTTNEREIASGLMPASKTIAPDTAPRRAFAHTAQAILESAAAPSLHIAARALAAALARVDGRAR